MHLTLSAPVRIPSPRIIAARLDFHEATRRRAGFLMELFDPDIGNLNAAGYLLRRHARDSNAPGLRPAG